MGSVFPCPRTRGASTSLAALLLSLTASGGAAQSPQPPAEEPGASISVVLLTMGPGDAIWEKFGHDAIWIRDPGTGMDIAYNWGMFAFGAEDFIPRLARGTMRYWMAGYDAEATLRAYAAARRDVFAQELRLTPQQRLELVRYLRETDTDANRYYSYDYYLDNCATRVRDALDRVLGGRVAAALDTVATGTTWRDHARRILRTTLPAYVGMELALGTPADRPITAWEEAFLPLKLRDRLRQVSVPDASGQLVPLVVREVQLVDGGRAPEPETPPFWLPWFLLVGVLGALLMVGPPLASRAASAAGGLWRASAGLAALWSLVAGAAGLLLVLAWLFTNHIFWYWNENLLQTSPLSLLLVPPLILAVLGRPLPRWAGPLAAGVLAVSLTGFALQALPGFDQVNGEIIALVLPLHAAVTWLALSWRARGSAAERS